MQVNNSENIIDKVSSCKTETSVLYAFATTYLEKSAEHRRDGFKTWKSQPP